MMKNYAIVNLVKISEAGNIELNSKHFALS